MTRVWDLELPDSDKIVLLALADCANDEGHCWPSVASLVRKCSKSERTIQGCIKRLVEEGLLIRREVLGKGCNYTVLPQRPAASAPRSDNAPAGNAPPQPLPPTPAAAADKPSRTINTEAKASSQRVVDYYNSKAKKHGWPQVRVLDASRKQQLRLRTKQHGESGIIQAIDAMCVSPFLRGEGRDGKWRPDFDFLLQPQSLRRLIEGFYGEDDPKPVRRTPEEQREWYLKNAEFYDKIGRPDDAAECRRKADRCLELTPVRLGIAAAQIVAGMRAQ
jgi:hypothetical protein